MRDDAAIAQDRAVLQRLMVPRPSCFGKGYTALKDHEVGPLRQYQSHAVDTGGRKVVPWGVPFPRGANYHAYICYYACEHRHECYKACFPSKGDG